MRNLIISLMLAFSLASSPSFASSSTYDDDYLNRGFSFKRTLVRSVTLALAVYAASTGLISSGFIGTKALNKADRHRLSKVGLSDLAARQGKGGWFGGPLIKVSDSSVSNAVKVIEARERLEGDIGKEASWIGFMTATSPHVDETTLFSHDADKPTGKYRAAGKSLPQKLMDAKGEDRDLIRRQIQKQIKASCGDHLQKQIGTAVDSQTNLARDRLSETHSTVVPVDQSHLLIFSKETIRVMNLKELKEMEANVKKDLKPGQSLENTKLGLTLAAFALPFVYEGIKRVVYPALRDEISRWFGWRKKKKKEEEALQG